MIALKSSGIVANTDLGALHYFLSPLKYNAFDTRVVTGTIEEANLCSDMGTARAQDMR